MRLFSYTLSSCAFLALIFSCNQTTEPQASMDTENPIIPVTYPETEKIDHTDNYFGTDVADPYQWLEDDNSEETKAWVVEQNEVTFDYLGQIPFRDDIEQRLTEIWNYPKYGRPFKRGNHYYFYKNDGLQNHYALYRLANLDDEPELVLDPNTFSDDGSVSLSGIDIRNDGKYMAFSKAQSGSDWRTFYVMDLETLEMLPDVIEWAKFTGADWWGDGFYYKKYPEPQDGDEYTASNENPQIFYHKLGTDQSTDELFYERPDDSQLSFGVSITDDEKYMLLYTFTGASNSNGLWIQEQPFTSEGFSPIREEIDHAMWFVENVDDGVLIMTNHEAPNYKVVKVDPSNPTPDQWETVIEEKDYALEDVSLVSGNLLATYLVDVANQIHIYNLNGELVHEVELPTIGTVSGFSGKKDDKELFYTITSFTYPSVQYRFNVEDFSSSMFRKSGAQFDPEDYETKQVFFKSTDGTEVPMFLVHKKGIELDGNNPTMMYGYGGFNISIKPSFSISRIPFLEGGGVYASVNLRGGAEYGQDWHEAGMLLKKQNVFDDFISAAEWLIDNNYTSSDRLAISGRSNGGLLVGACMTQRPDLFAVAMPGVGVMDMLKFHQFTIGHAWVPEYGSSEDSIHFHNLHGYSPLHNLEDGVDYPATMITTADHDDRVVPAHSFKFAARLQEAHAVDSDEPVLIRIETKAGHGAGKPTDQIIKDHTDSWAFVMYNLDMQYSAPTE